MLLLDRRCSPRSWPGLGPDPIFRRRWRRWPPAESTGCPLLLHGWCGRWQSSDPPARWPKRQPSPTSPSSRSARSPRSPMARLDVDGASVQLLRRSNPGRRSSRARSRASPRSCTNERRSDSNRPMRRAGNCGRPLVRGRRRLPARCDGPSWRAKTAFGAGASAEASHQFERRFSPARRLQRPDAEIVDPCRTPAPRAAHAARRADLEAWALKQAVAASASPGAAASLMVRQATCARTSGGLRAASAYLGRARRTAPLADLVVQCELFIEQAWIAVWSDRWDPPSSWRTSARSCCRCSR